MYDATVFDKVRTLVPSKRGELEITDVNNAYIQEGSMTFDFLEGWWTDAGTFDSLLRAANLVAQSVTARRQAEAEKLAAEGADAMTGASGARERSRLPQSGSLELVYPECPKGIGSVIASPTSAGLIEGVRIEPLALWPDDRGYFLEVQRMGRGLAAHFPPETTQTSTAFNYPGTIKAFHYHLHQTDCWTPAMGMFQVALVDLRAGFATLSARVIPSTRASLRPWQILIPPGVGHGYKVIGDGPAMLIYMTDKFYNPEDEGRIPYNHPGINYDWEIQHK